MLHMKSGSRIDRLHPRRSSSLTPGTQNRDGRAVYEAAGATAALLGRRLGHARIGRIVTSNRAIE